MSFELSTQADSIQRFLDRQAWLDSNERVESAERAGEGNMNRTVRVRTNRRSFVLKQSYPYCAKFPEIPAPIDRIAVEVGFYGIARRSEVLAEHMPEILAFAPKDHLAMIEDLGAGSDLLSLYASDDLGEDELALLCRLAEALHVLPLSPEERTSLRNQDMRALNQEHIFDIPLRRDNGLDLESLTPGLQTLADELKRDVAYRNAIAELGRIYTSASGPVLLHGDYYPGSILRTERGLAIIDPEFAFPGPAEFDLGVLVAHLVFAGRRGPCVVDAVLGSYRPAVDRRAVEGFAAAELMRRTLGVSQLPIEADLETKRAWLAQSRAWLAPG